MGRSARGDVRPEARGEGLCDALCLSQHSCVFKQMAGFDRLTRGGRVGKVGWIKTGGRQGDFDARKGKRLGGLWMCPYICTDI